MAQIPGLFLNEKGNPTSLRNDIKMQAETKLSEVLGLTPAANGGAYRLVGQDDAGVSVYAVYSVTITHADPAVAKPRKEKAAKETVELPELFQSEASHNEKTPHGVFFLCLNCGGVKEKGGYCLGLAAISCNLVTFEAILSA